MGNFRLMNSPLISIITTVYNCDKFIREAINSIYNQTFKDFEFIIYNDCSTDRTMNIILETLKELKIKKHIIINSIVGENLGCGYGRNKAIAKATGEYIALYDGDDISFSSRLEKEVDFLEKNNNIFCVSAWAEVINEKGEHIKTFDYPPQFYDDIKKEILVNHNNPIIDPCSMFKREIFNKLGGYDKKWRLVPDFNLWTRAVQNGYKFANLAEVLVDYRQHPNSVTNKSKMAVVREHFKMCKEILSE